MHVSAEGAPTSLEGRRDGAAALARSIARAVASHQHAPLLIALILLCVAFQFLSPVFFTSANALNIGRQIAITSVVAFGATIVIISGEIDLSVGSVMGITSVLIGIILHGTPVAATDPGANELIAVLAAVGLGLGIGLLNGVVTVFGRIPSFIVTLGTLSIARGLAQSYGTGVPDPITSRSFLATFGDGQVLGIPVLIVYMFAALAATAFLLRGTLFGIQTYATGGNTEAARLAGIPVRRVKVVALALGGLLAGFAGVMGTARVQTALPQLGLGIELDAIAAVVLGGTRFSGGYGTVVGTLLGAVLIGVINNGLTLMSVSSTYQLVIKGTVIIVAVLLDRIRPR